MRRSLPLALALLLSALAAPAGRAEVHPFYQQRLTAGVLALSQGDAAGAERELRIAAFGLLDEPARLIVALAHLALAEQAAGDAAGLDETLQRLLTVEQRFAVWAGAELPAAARQAAEALLAERVPESGLAAVPAFREIAEERAAQRLAELPAAERRRQLAALAAAHPDSARWQVMLGELALADGDHAEAVARAQRALTAEPSGRQEVAARCLRGTALARAGSCAAAVADLEVCPATRREPEAAHTLLDCHATLGQWRQAQELGAALPAAVRSRRDVARLLRRVEREAAAAAPPAAGRPAGPGGERAPAEVAAGGPTRQEAVPAAPPAAAPLPAEDRRRLARARELMAAARRAADLEEPLELARAVADAHPGSREAQHLAAEIAYRASRWPLAVRYFRRGGEPVESPERMFYLAVALWEAGERAEAVRVLEATLPRLARTPFVDRYVAAILGEEQG